MIDNKFRTAVYITMAAVYLFFMTSLIASCIKSL